jgi:hypothetical protein
MFVSQVVMHSKVPARILHDIATLWQMKLRGWVLITPVSVQHDVVDLPLWHRESAADGPRPRDVAGVAVQLAAAVEQEQVAGRQQLVVAPVVHRQRVGAGCHHRRILHCQV